jgi:PAS domain S-box-containing protein
MTATYNLGLGALSFAIALIASYTALDLAGRVQLAVRLRRWLWLLGGAVAMGTGIWSMHFIAMLAFQLPHPVHYDIAITLLSLLCAVLASGVALSLLSWKVSIQLLLGGGIFMGMAIAGMHYTGMAAMQLMAKIEYDWRLVSLSVAIAISASFAALTLAFRLQNQSLKGLLWQKFASAFIMAIAISGMHYTGMWATHFIPLQDLPALTSPAMNRSWLASAIGMATLFILSLALLTSLFDKHLTAQLVREQALEESEKRFRMLIREMQVGVLLLNANAEILISNQAAIALFNLQPEDVPPQVFGENCLLLHEDGTPFQTKELPVQQAIARRQPIHNIVIGIDRPDNEETGEQSPIQNLKRSWLLVNADPQIAEDGSVERIVCTLSDITHQKQAQAALRHSEERFALAVEGVNDGIWDWNLQTGDVYMSPRLKSMLGYEEQEIPNNIDSFKQILHPEDSERVLTVLLAYIAGKIPNYQVEFRAIHKDGSVRWLLTRGAALRDKTGAPYRMAGSHTDITSRKQKEEALQLIAEGTASATGNEFFRSCVRYLAQILQIRYAVVGQVANDAKTRVRTLAFWTGKDFGENFEYDLDGTPCENVVGGTSHFYPSGIQEVFPKYRSLVELGAQSYWGMPLIDSAGNVIGNLVVLDVQPMKCDPGKETILKIFVARAGAELERKLAEESLQRRAKMDGLLSSISRMFIDENPDSTINFTLQAVGEFLGSDRTYLFRYNDNQSFLKMTHEWCDFGIEPLISKFQEFPVKNHHWVNSQILSGETVLIPAEQTPEAAEQAAWELKSIKSRLAVPTLHSGKVIGFMGLDAVRSSKVWSQEEINWLRLVNEFIAISQARQEARAALQRSNTRYQNLAQNVPGMIYQYILYPNGSTAFPYVSAGCREIFGLEPEEVMNNATGAWSITHPDDIADLNRSIVSSAQTFEPWDFTWRVVVSGQIKWLRGNSRPELQADGSILWDGLVTDITSSKQAEEALQETAEREKAIANVIQRMRQTLEIETIFTTTNQELRQALKCDRVGVYRFNPDWSGNFVSESVVEGWKPLVSQHKHQPELSQVAVNETDCNVKTLSSEDNLIQDTYLQKTQGGIYRQRATYCCVPDIYKAGFPPCYLSLLEKFQARAYIIVPIFGGNRLWGLLAAYQNSSSREWKQTEIRMLIQIGEHLGVAIQQAQLLAQTQNQAEELKKAKESAVSEAARSAAANHAKSDFLASMSHELRTPLNAILGFSQVMNRDSSLSEENQEYLGIINRAGEHLLKLIDDVLEMSKIEAGRITLNENDFDLLKFLKTLEEMFYFKAKDKGLQLIFERTVNVPQYVKIDESKLRQILINLLGNAIKFTQNGSVSLKVKSINGAPPVPGLTCETQSRRNSKFKIEPEIQTTPKQKQTTIRFEIEDTGPGIEPEEIGNVFNAFVQTETGRQSQEGTGLGLPISKKFVELMGGEIAVSSTVGKGTIFCFDVSIKLPETTDVLTQTPTRKAIGLAPNQPEYRILVVEDRFENRLLLVRLLRSIGFQVREAENGQEGVAIWESWQPHLIWMDMRMPVMDGYEATKRIRAHLKGQETVIIALTASAFEEQRNIVLSAGCDDFLGKPFREDVLLEKMGQYLGVNYVYEDSQQENLQSQVSNQQSQIEQPLETLLKQMPNEWIGQLRNAAFECSDNTVLELVEEILPVSETLANTLTDWANNFRFDLVIDLIEESKKLNERSQDVQLF